MFGLAQNLHFWLWEIPRVPTRHSHILCKIYERIYQQKD